MEILLSIMIIIISIRLLIISWEFEQLKEDFSKKYLGDTYLFKFLLGKFHLTFDDIKKIMEEDNKSNG